MDLFDAPATPATDFRLYHANALDVLAGLLAEALRTPAPGQPLLAPDTILIPQAAMRRWLQATLAQRHGIAANLEFLTPGEFVTRALDANLGPVADDLDAASLQWRLYGALTDRAITALPPMAQLAAYLDGDDLLKPWTLAAELANVYGKYQAWRRDWLLRWEAGADPDDPQAILWRAVAGGRSHRARRIQDYLTRFVEGEARPAGLPTRLFVFATLNISPDVLRVMASQARVGTLHFYLPTPTKEYWGDLQSFPARLLAQATTPSRTDPSAATAAGNPLLRDWGAAGRDFMALLGSYEVVHPSGDIPAYTDPAEATGPTLADGGLRDSLLHRMQADLFHDRAPPVANATDDVATGSPPPDDVRDARLPKPRSDDPSLQAHACHTRLRELQVLHDRLRALLEPDSPEGRRFDPPLQPREIAVLAPDIDPYVPYLDAVFGGGGGGGGGHDGHGANPAIPYAVADASPLAGEPLAEVFLRLLALPVSRFGLQELLDLLASAPLSEAAGLEADALSRLHDWLHAAGARWGLDAAHRARHGAPEDAAYTWQFALDRLLLGHASGSDMPIAGVAPWPELEGGALDALDVLLRLLRVLARYARAFDTAMPPHRWRERLLGLLDALLPQPPATPSTQRALERLRGLVDDFARHAQTADFDAPVPCEVVRAHFAAILGEADTRAPLLTGGVSFARMVPMRLLPFRVVCLLGMDDAAFPRCDSAAGLNRLTSQLGTDQRRRGDRSTRDDDRQLFLQLFAAAQDVFYVSWLGADPRDGSVRQPSTLVSELLATAGEYHASADTAVRDLVMHHPLQPFSPAAFGAGDDRLFSYRGQWHDAAGQLAGARKPLAPWMAAGTTLSPPDGPDTELSLEALRRFLLDPAGQFLRQRLDVRLPELDAADDDIEPLQAPQRGLQRSQLQSAVLDALLDNQDNDTMQARLRAQGLLPSGPPGRRTLQEIVDEIAPYANAFSQWRGTAEPQILPVEVDIDGLRLHGHIADAWPQGIARLRFGTPNGRSSIRNGLDWLLATAAGIDTPFVDIHDDANHGIGAHPRPPLSRDAAIEALRQLLALRNDGLRAPLLFAPYSAWELFAADLPERGVTNSVNRWRGSERSWAEGDGDALRLALRGRDPFADHDTLREFARIAGTVFGAVVHGAPAAIDIGQASVPEHDDDAEDAA